MIVVMTNTLRLVNLSDPSLVRRQLQTSYDDYRAGRVLEPRIAFTEVTPDVLSTGLEERIEFLDKVSSQYPKKSREVVRSLMIEQIFLQACVLESTRTIAAVTETASLVSPDEGEKKILGVAGYGRNGKILALGNSATPDVKVLLVHDRRLPSIFEQGQFDLMIFDPDMMLEEGSSTPWPQFAVNQIKD